MEPQIPRSLSSEEVVQTFLWDVGPKGPDTQGAGTGILKHRSYLLGRELHSRIWGQNLWNWGRTTTPRLSTGEKETAGQTCVPRT